MTDTTTGSAKDEVDQLKSRVQELSNPVRPAVANAADQARQYAQQTQAVVADRADEAAVAIRRNPLAAVLIACGAGYLFGRIVR